MSLAIDVGEHYPYVFTSSKIAIASSALEASIAV